jgi:hypothetical protein
VHAHLDDARDEILAFTAAGMPRHREYAYVDPATLKRTASSHRYTKQMTGARWIFDWHPHGDRAGPCYEWSLH